MTSLNRPLHILGAGSIGLLFATCIRLKNPWFPVKLLLRAGTPTDCLRRYDQELRINGLYNRISFHISPRNRILVNQEGTVDSTDEYHQYHDDDYYVLAARKSNHNDIIDVVDIPVEIVSTLPNPTEATVHRVLVATKAQDASRAIDSIAHRFEPHGETQIVILCNGILALMNELKDKNIQAQVISASTTHGAHRGNQADFGHLPSILKPSCWNVVHAGVGSIYLQKEGDRNHDMEEILRLSDLNPVSLTWDEMNIIHWKKLVANCTINPLTALHKCLNGQILTSTHVEGESINPYSRDSNVLHELVHELSQLAQAEVGKSESLSYENLIDFVYQVIQKTAHNRSSMLQDIEAGRSTEIEYLNAYVVNLGRTKYGLGMDVNNSILHKVRRLERASVERQDGQ